ASTPAEEAPTATPAPAEEAQPAAPARPVRPTSESTPAESSGSLLDTLKQYWWAIAALLAAMVALLGLRAWRARQQAEFDDSLGRLAGAPGRSFNTSDTAPIRALESEPTFVVEESGTHERPRFSPAAGAVAAAAPRNVTSEETISSDTAVNLDQ